jgi:PAS domain S-box-containing protein
MLATPLIIVGHWISISENTPEWESWFNRSSSIGSVWLTAVFVWRTRVLKQKLQRQIDVVSSQLRKIAWLASIVECSDDAIVSKSLEGIITSWNKAAERIFGYLPEEAIGKSITSLIPHEHEHERVVERIRHGERVDHFETVRRHKDGRLIDVSVTASPMRDVNDNLVGASMIARDITERKEREEREHLLMREINHRAKNMLSVVDAIAHQTAAKTPDDFIERFSDRIQALSANQDLLIRNDWHGVESEDLVCAQLAPFADHIGSRIVVRGPRLRLNAASAQAIGLALHELTTNAGKYGALSNDTGRLDVGWGTQGETFTMSWTERDGPPVSSPQRRGFGTIVMQEMAERSVDGRVELGYAPSGMTRRLTCPATKALEQGRYPTALPVLTRVDIPRSADRLPQKRLRYADGAGRLREI